MDNNKLSSRAITPQDEALWKDQYDNRQVNLDEEFEALSNKVAVARQNQQDLQASKNKKSLWEAGDLQEFNRRMAAAKSLEPLAVGRPAALGPDIIRRPAILNPKISGFDPPVLSDWKAFAIDACANPDAPAWVNMHSPEYNEAFRHVDEMRAASLSAGLGACPRQLFNRLIELFHARQYGNIDRNWLRDAVNSYSRGSNGYAPPTHKSNGGEGRSSGGVSPPPPAVEHDPRREAFRELEAEEEIARRKRWGLRPVR